MPRVRSLEGREAGILARGIQGMFKMMLGQPLNPIKVYAQVPRAMLASFLANMMFESSRRWVVGPDLVRLARIRAAALNGCPF